MIMYVCMPNQHYRLDDFEEMYMLEKDFTLK